jgi:hypothetical protein
MAGTIHHNVLSHTAQWDIRVDRLAADAARRGLLTLRA